MSAPDWMFSLADATARLPEDPNLFRFRYGLRRGSMKIGLYAPKDQDTQTPHKQDELYIVISGTADFIKAQERRPCASQDVIFVEAGAAHRFENFSEDFSTWVIFWGPEGGETIK
jgi:mannose-6-phosphate isomerase-like protein (cupin superfamily)